MKPTIVLVHGAFAESASWERVIDPLLEAGQPVIAAANPLR
ncbi:MAG: alpha/beta hydrolase, partial [Actinomycetota bacterium]|nr:alpha/beta hydrolase [Actinomycetota bacterium]